MAAKLAGSIRFLLCRQKRYYARRVVPVELREIIGRSELREPLGADRRRAIEQLPVGLVKINALLDHARTVLYERQVALKAYASARSAPMDVTQVARTHYEEQLALDEALRNSGSGWAKIGINDGYVADLRAACAGTLSDGELSQVIGQFMRRYELRGNIQAPLYTPEWRSYARGLANAELEVLSKMYERDEGLPDPLRPPSFLQSNIADSEPKFVAPLSMLQLLETHLTRLETNGGGVSTRKAWRPVFDDLLRFLKDHRGLKGSAISQADDVHRLQPDELIVWRDLKLQKLSPKCD